MSHFGLLPLQIVNKFLLYIFTAMDSRKNDEKLEVISISDVEENEALVKLNNDFQKTSSKIKESTPCSIMDAAIKTSDTSFVLEPVREEQSRPNKLSRSRAPLNQQKYKDTSGTKILLTTMDETSLTSNGNSEHDVAFASTQLSLAPTYNETQNVDGNSLALSRMDSMKPSQDRHTKASTTQSVMTSFGSSFEPELVLSPAKLGQ